MIRAIAAILLLMVAVSCNSNPDVSQEHLADLGPLIDSARVTYAPDALAYLEAALDTLAAHHVYGPGYDWEELRLAALERTAGAQTREKTYEAILFALRDLDDPHTYFIPPKRDSTASVRRPDRPESTQSDTARALRSWQVNLDARLLDGSVAYLGVPSFTGTDTLAVQEYVHALHDLIRGMEKGDPCGWIIDLRRNAGGNMWPMLAGIGPLLGAERVGSFVDRRGTHTPWYYRDGRALMDTTVLAAVRAEPFVFAALSPVAVLTSEHTGSAGEAVVVAFKGRPNTRSFGHATAGAVTGHKGFQLADGALLGFSVVYYADRYGHVYDGPIPPDVTVESEMTGNLGEPKEAAMMWLNDLPECRPKKSEV